MRRAILIGLCLLFAIAAFSQKKDHEPMNAVKLDFLGPLPVYRTGRIDFPWWRTVLRYERKTERFKHLSVVGDLEYRRDGGPILDRIHGTSVEGILWSNRQSEFTLFGGMKYFVHIVNSKGFQFTLFAEPRLGLALRHCYIYEFYGDQPSVTINRFGIIPRLRSGIGFIFFKTLGFEVAGDFGRFKLLGMPYHEWRLYPELSLVVWF